MKLQQSAYFLNMKALLCRCSEALKDVAGDVLFINSKANGKDLRKTVAHITQIELLKIAIWFLPMLQGLF